MKNLKLNEVISTFALSALLTFSTNIFAQTNEESVVENISSTVPNDVLQNNPLTALRSKLLKVVKEKDFGSESDKKYVSEHPNAEYAYSSNDFADCKTAFGFISYCYRSSNAPEKISKKFTLGKVDIDAKKEELSKAIENAKMIMETRVGAGVYYLLQADNKVMVIDTNYPLEVNPVMVQDGTKSEKLVAFGEEVNDQSRNTKNIETKQAFGGVFKYSTSESTTSSK